MRGFCSFGLNSCRTWALAALLAASPVAGEGELVDRIVAILTVQGPADCQGGGGLQATQVRQLITWSDLRFEAAVALIQRGAPHAAVADLDDHVLRGALEYSIAQRLETADADRLKECGDARAPFELEPREVDEAEAAFARRLGSAEAFAGFLARFDADRQQLGRLLARSLRAEKILDSKLRLRAQVPESEVRRHYEAHREGLEGGYEQVRATLREHLFRQRYAALAEAELAQLRRRAEVRLVAPFAAEAAADRP